MVGSAPVGSGRTAVTARKSRPGWRPLGFSGKEKGPQEGKEMAGLGGKTQRKPSIVWKELCLSHQEKDRLHQPCFSYQTLPGHHLQVQSD